MANKRRIYISDHGTFTMFNMNISLPAIIELTDDQITYINNSGLYKISELSASQNANATPTALSKIEGDRFERSRTISVNELSFKTPILGTKFAESAKNAVIVKKNSIYAKAAMGMANKTVQNDITTMIDNNIVKEHNLEDNKNNKKERKSNLDTNSSSNNKDGE